MKPAERPLRRAPLRVALILLALLAGASTASAQVALPPEDAAEPFVFELLDFLHRFEADGTHLQIARSRIRIQNEAGKQAMGEIYIPYSERLGTVEFRYVKTIKPNGNTIEASLDTVMEVSAPVVQVAPVFSDIKYKAIPVAGLQVGDVVDYEVEIRIDKPLKPGSFWGAHVAQTAAKVDSERVVLDLPAEVPVKLALADTSEPSIEEAEGRRVYTWELTNESAREPVESPERLFSVSTFTDWEQVGNWLRELMADRDRSSPELDALYAELTAGLSTKREKAERIFDHVARSIRYVSISLGIGGYQPHAAGETLRNQYGDCKDKHTLLAALLAKAGIEAHPALMRTVGKVEREVPSPAEFDHMVTVATLDGEPIWSDSTTGMIPFGFLPRAWRDDKHALVVRKEAASLVPIPASGPVRDTLQSRLAGAVDGAGQYEGHLELEVRGDAETVWRPAAMTGDSRHLRSALYFNGPYPPDSAEIGEIEAEGAHDLRQPLRVRFELSANPLIDPVAPADGIELSSLLTGARRAIDFMLENFDQGATDPAGMMVGGPLTRLESVELEVDPGFSVTPPEDLEIENEVGSYRAAYSFEGQTLRIRREFRVDTVRVSPERHESFKALAATLARDLDREIIFSRPPGFDASTVVKDLNADTLNDLGVAAIDREALDEAVEYFKQATVKDPQHGNAWYNIGWVEFNRGNYDAARAAYEKQIEVTPDHKEATQNLALLGVIDGGAQDGLEVLLERARRNPTDPAALGTLGAMYMGLGDYAAAEEAFKKAEALDPTRNEALYGLGFVQQKLGKHEEATATFERLLGRDGSPLVYSMIADTINESGGDLDMAFDYAQSAVMRTGAEFSLIRNLAGWERQLEVQSFFATALGSLGKVQLKRGELKEAVANLEAAYRVLPEPRSALQLSLAHAALGNTEESLNLFARHVHLTYRPDFDVPPEIRKLTDARFPEGEAHLKHWIDEERLTFAHWLALKPEDGGKLSWPEGVEPGKTVEVRLVALVNEDGSVREVTVESGEAPFAQTALADTKRIRFEEVRWQGRAIRTLRRLTFTYQTPTSILAERVSHAGYMRPGWMR